MLLSIIMPAHNAAAYLPRTLELLEREMQGLEQVEVIAIDDASGDETASILADFAQRHAWLRWVAVDFANVGKARQAGIAQSCGRYLTFLDSDDAFLAGGLAWLCGILQAREPALLMSPLWETSQPPDGQARWQAGAMESLSTAEACALFAEHRRLQGHFIGKCVARELLASHPMSDMRCYEDLATTPYWIASSASILWCDAPFYAYYKRPGSLSDRGRQWRHSMEYVEALQAVENAFDGHIGAERLAPLWIGLAYEQMREEEGRAFLVAHPLVQDKIRQMPLWRYALGSGLSWRWRRRLLSLRWRLARKL